ncbi:TetR/AcrR family transcriptional regulator [Streptomyces boncukensis]|uniref:TetR/AcrR family transcriptional regulator n=1 Tax=Streptomyces boncukensis TaxID=2711219 RepID=A0A6G4WZY8_9ACTN|nr:TetR/AcrR family transcriptional regulator [Streptomyces boncukensis]NGO70200.1 TetR/AcrR family transcriptional regulator [Streptomyces boncukensis]
MSSDAVAFNGISKAREKVLEAAYALFSRRGIRDVGVDEIVSRSGVAKATLYRHFPSKDALVLAFLRRREELWTLGMVESGARSRAATPEGRLLAIFDVFDDWFHDEDFDACTFVNVLLEMRWDHPLGRASIEHLANIRALVRRMADEAGLESPEEFARSWHMLMKGAVIAAAEGDRHAAVRARDMARDLIARHRGPGGD